MRIFVGLACSDTMADNACKTVKSTMRAYYKKLHNPHFMYFSPRLLLEGILSLELLNLNGRIAQQVVVHTGNTGLVLAPCGRILHTNFLCT